jgi:hypothetical protein
MAKKNWLISVTTEINLITQTTRRARCPTGHGTHLYFIAASVQIQRVQQILKFPKVTGRCWLGIVDRERAPEQRRK